MVVLVEVKKGKQMKTEAEKKDYATGGIVPAKTGGYLRTLHGGSITFPKGVKFLPISPPRIKTDLEKFVELYKGFGIECKVEKTDTGSVITLACEGSYSHENYETASDKFDGYPGFHTDITFDKNGKFIKQGFWE